MLNVHKNIYDDKNIQGVWKQVDIKKINKMLIMHLKNAKHA